jgi:hypothetical protein
MDELETRLQNFFSEPSEDKAKSLVPVVLKNQKSFENIITRMISKANYESLYKIADGCGKIANCAHKTIGVLDYVHKRMKILGEPKNPTERSYLALIETQFSWVRKEHTPYSPSPMQAYARH